MSIASKQLQIVLNINLLEMENILRKMWFKCYMREENISAEYLEYI